MKCVSNGVIDNTPPDLCQGVIFIEPHDLINMTHPEFAFNQDVFNQVVGGIILAFVLGHFSGRVVRWLGKL